MIAWPPHKKAAKTYDANATIRSRDLTQENVLAATTGGITLTLPTPAREFLGQGVWIADTAATAITISCTSGILGGSSCVVEPYSAVFCECIKYGTTYKWLITGQSTALTGLSETIADVVGNMVTGNTETAGLAVVYQDADNTLDFTLTYGSDANTICQGNDARLLTTAEKAALGSSANWADIAPTVTWDTAPASVTMVARKRRVGNSIEFYIDLSGADGDDRTLQSIAMPDSALDQNARIRCASSQYVADNTPAYTDPHAYVDAETDLGVIKFPAAVACVNTKAWRIIVSGSYEVAAS